MSIFGASLTQSGQSAYPSIDAGCPCIPTLTFQVQRGTYSPPNPPVVKPLPIPTSNLPPLLDSSVVFRQISSGGFAGRTYETALLADGLLMRTRIGDANDSERSVHHVSLQKLRQFQQLLAAKGAKEFQNLSYPAPSGAADYISYTLTSSNGTVQYNDISQNRLPQNLQVVVAAWNQLLREAQE
jgi:hypothetical protein